MRRTLLLLCALVPLHLAGCGAESAPAPAVPAEPAAPAAAPAPAPPDPLVNTIWVNDDSGAPRGDLRIFLADGTLVVDSCWEVYALRTWRRTAPDRLVLVEDVEIPARIVALDAGTLRLELELIGGERQEVAYRKATVPFVCPEMAR